MAFDGTLKFDTAIDKTGFQLGISNLGNIAKAGMGVVTAAIGAASASVSALGGYAVKVGKEFESSMAQVIATMGITKDTIQDGANSYDLLKEAAAAAGESTTFSASEAANALNYLALAGYSASQAADALPAVLNLAAAGGLDLAYASDLATDAMAALGIEATKENLTHFGDQMAKTASKANTSVAQLGEAILTVGGTAKSLKGGTNELNAALGVLANRGIKGSEGGTALRNIILALSAPTDKAAEAIKNLGLEVYETDGTLRPLNAIFSDLNDSLDNMNDSEKTQVLNEIFNKVDLKSAQALLAGCGDEFDNLTAELASCDGAMAQMAKTMNDTLEGDLKSLQSKAESFGNAIYGSLNEPLRDLVQLGGAYVSQLTTAFEDGGFDGLAESLGDVLGQAVTKLSGYVPKLVQMGTSFVSSLVKGLTKNAPAIAETGITIGLTLLEGVANISADLLELGTSLLTALAEGIMENLPEIRDTAKDILSMLSDSLSNNLPVLLEIAIVLLEEFAAFLAENLSPLVSAAIQMVQTLCDTLLQQENLERILEAGLQILDAVVNALVDNLPMLVNAALQIILFLSDALLNPEHIAMLLKAAVEILLAFVNAIIDNIDEILLAAETIVRTICEELLTPENIESLLTAGAELLGSLIRGLCQLAGKLLGFGAMLFEEIETEIEDPDWETIGWEIVEGIVSGLIGVDFKLADYLNDFKENWVTGIKDVFGIHSPSKVMKDDVGTFLALGIGEGFEDSMASVGQRAIAAVTAWTSELPEIAQETAEQFLQCTDDGFSQIPGKAAEHLKDALNRVIDWGTSVCACGRSAAQNLVNIIAETVSKLPDKMASIGQNLVEGLWNGITGMGNWLKDKISGFADDLLSGFKDAFGIHSPSTVMRDYVGKYLAQGVGIGFAEELPDVDMDGSVTAMDASLILQAASAIGAGEESGLTPEQLLAADADMDGSINAIDASLVLEYAAAVGAGDFPDTPQSWTHFLNRKLGLEEVIY